MSRWYNRRYRRQSAAVKTFHESRIVDLERENQYLQEKDDTNMQMIRNLMARNQILEAENTKLQRTTDSNSKMICTLMPEHIATAIISTLGNTCGICLAEVKNLRITWCGHIFCEHCIQRWEKRKRECPMCKKNYT